MSRVDLQVICINFQYMEMKLVEEKEKEENHQCKKTLSKYKKMSTLYFNQIYETLNLSLLSYINGIVKSGNFTYDIEQELTIEAHQDTFLNFHNKINLFDPTKKMTTWIYKIAQNEALKILYRERLNRKEISFTDLTGNKSEDEEYNIRNIMNELEIVNKTFENTVFEISDINESLFSKKYELALQCIEELPDKYKSIIKDKYIYNIKQINLEEYYNLNLNTIKTRDRKAKKDLQSLYNKRIQPILLEHSKYF